MIDPNSQGGTVWHGDDDDGKYKTPDSSEIIEDGLDRIVDALDSPPCPICASGNPKHNERYGGWIEYLGPGSYTLHIEPPAKEGDVR